MLDLLRNMGTGARVGLLVGMLGIAVFMVGGGFWVLRPDYEVLFSDLSPQDAVVMTSELDKGKTPYRLENQGTAIAVPKDAVYKTRIALMGKDLPLHGTVGFELFNNSDFGATEFAQKVNYQRALQGEITRTILSISEVRTARLHLAIPEDTLFKKSTNVAKASVFLSMKDGQRLTSVQVSGIQRLVAAAVPGIQRQDVTIVDDHGVALTRNVSDAVEGIDGSPRLDLKRETEVYLERKAQAVLDKALGAGQGMASVAVALDMDRVQVTTEDVLAPPVRNGEPATGVIVHERLMDRRTPGAPPVGPGPDGGGLREVDYQVGRRVERIVSAPGTVRRIQVAAVMRQPVGPDEGERLRSLLMAAVGGSADRGDSVVVQAMVGADDGRTQADPVAGGGDQPIAPSARSRAVPAVQGGGITLSVFLIGAVALLGVLCAAFFARRRRIVSLSDTERAVLLERIENWLAQPDTGARALSGAGVKSEPQ
ncbi:MAG: flagellar basal-body MS-ring/collar protein FliF [Rhodocyclaceae bacterium]